MTLSKQLDTCLAYTRGQVRKHKKRKMVRRKAVFLRARLLIRDVRLSGGHVPRSVERVILNAYSA